MALMMSFFSIQGLFGCDESSPAPYEAASEFYWSDDGGSTYRNGLRNYEVGTDVLMKVILYVSNGGSDKEKIGVSLSIPYIQDVVSKQMDGGIITPEVDDLQHTTTYNFDITSNSSKNWELLFKFTPIKATDVVMTLVFDDKVDSIYDRRTTFTFVDKSSKNSESDESM